MKLTTDGHEASRGLSATAELLVDFTFENRIIGHILLPKISSLYLAASVTKSKLIGRFMRDKFHGRL